MSIRIIDCEQNSDEWIAARLGLPTSSQFSVLLAKGRGGGESKTRRTYLNKLAGEILTGAPMDTYSNAHMERGHEMENDARQSYAWLTDYIPMPVGFVVNDELGAGSSPDSLIGDDGILEIKTALPHILIDHIRKDVFPAEHKAQCQGQLLVTGRKWVDIAIYWPGLPLFTKRTYRDEEYLSALTDAIRAFQAELSQTVDMVRGYGAQEAAA